MNIVLALLFLPFAFITTGFLAQVVAFGYLINVWLALFNLIPFFILDGKKIWDWNKMVWGGAVSVSILLLVIRSYLPFVSIF